jgi:DNA-binding beta-propeller fold protein YncE
MATATAEKNVEAKPRKSGTKNDARRVRRSGLIPAVVYGAGQNSEAIAVDPNRAVAVVTNVLNQGTATVSGGLDVINLASTPPSKNNSASIGTLTANPTGIVYDPVPSPALFYVTSTQQNAIYAFNPDTSSTPSLIRVGVNPYSVAYNYQTGTLLSVNSTSNTSSVIDAVNAPVFATREMLGISSQSQFAGAIDNFTNTAILADQNNNRVVILPLK